MFLRSENIKNYKNFKFCLKRIINIFGPIINEVVTSEMESIEDLLQSRKKNQNKKLTRYMIFRSKHSVPFLFYLKKN